MNEIALWAISATATIIMALAMGYTMDQNKYKSSFVLYIIILVFTTVGVHTIAVRLLERL